MICVPIAESLHNLKKQQVGALIAAHLYVPHAETSFLMRDTERFVVHVEKGGG
jgi:hypothetical protein